MGIYLGMACTFIVSRDLFASLYCHLTIHVHSSLRSWLKASNTDYRRPESPRWLVHEGLYDEARTVVAMTNANGDLTNPVVLTIYKEIVDTLAWEKKEGKTMSPKEIVKTPSARKRLLIGMSPGPFSCVAGNIIASYYLGSELDTAGVTDSNDQLKAVSTSPLLTRPG